ncbi:glycosyltransferase family 4 protein [Geosporobacter ferrireducens]|uniref:Glycosyl transferase family 1 domain-containing protein n=1 Tax=Geosporobacter ferrireducens TaxID=1424294 RepID=A0A1D8GPQ9_9FIRM|nr:glycosyltransferase family 4 protein [Geosporobacter ferrireducens]AOT72848.1 hypothetical protein Gferi_26795 [Geosporobacter ferrireducens]MTI55249.1 glycosyltransferase family 4 protein [Geosporobacter ferrireducens]
MKILFFTRKDLQENPAGDTTIIQALKKHFRKHGIKVDLCTDHRVNIHSYDLIHLFNISRATELYNLIKLLPLEKKAVVLTPIYWDLSDYLKETNQAIKLNAWNSGERKRKYIFEHIDLSIPHCQGEIDLIKRNFNYRKDFEIIPYGVAPIQKESSSYINNRYGFKDYVLCVGRICRQKNQLSLIRALKDNSIPVVFVGKVNDEDYYKRCRAEAKENMIFIHDMHHHQLASLYQNAHAYVQPSWLEYPGLSSLEAGVAGCNIVSTEIGSVKEIFKDMIYYCHPNNLESIRSGIFRALEMPKSDLLKNYILEHYTWENYVTKLLTQYNHLLQLKKRSIEK